jgi:peptidoglycan/xylan/chitin deacetylase (PgdA/CDA1 family)
MRVGSLTTDDYRLSLALDYMDKAQIKEMYDSGHEISPHSRSHPFLTTLSGADDISEIA